YAQRPSVLRAAQRHVSSEVREGDRLLGPLACRQPSKVVDEVVGVRALRPFGEGGEELVGADMKDTSGDIADKVRSATVWMVHCLDAEMLGAAIGPRVDAHARESGAGARRLRRRRQRSSGTLDTPPAKEGGFSGRRLARR
ncbi:MAG: hypothetical protein QOG93_685, partial [Gaiellaceae bacterium]|nr:hypothetical protein [Gaiellaceae bacterium]